MNPTWVALTAGLLSGSLLPGAIKWIWRLITNAASREEARAEKLEQLVEVLRRALDKVRLREDALAQVLGVLIFGLKSIEKLSPSIEDALDRAIEILEGAQTRLQNINGEGGE